MDTLTRYPQRGGDRRLLDEILDEGVVAVLSTVADGLPWSVPIAYARLGDRIVLHGSTGAGALRHVAAGAPATLTVTHVDALIVADTAFDHSMNYRSAVLRGALTTAAVDGAELLDAFTDKLLPGRSAELRANTRKELAATTVLTFPITADNWIAKARTGGASSSEGGWSGVLPLRKGYARIEPTPGQELPVPASVRAALEASEDGTRYAPVSGFASRNRHFSPALGTVEAMSAPTSPASSPELTAALRAILDGRWAATRDVVREQIQDGNAVPQAGLSLDEYRELMLGQMKAMVPLGFPADGFKTEHGGTGDVGAAVTAIETLGYGDLSLMVKAGVQWGLFGGAVENLGTQYHHDTYVKGLIDLDVLGCFAMTETGHGSNVQELETTATYLPETDEFEIHSPTSSARKDYIGGAGKHARWASVFAQLITGGPGEEPTGRGVHCFVVPIRDENGDDLPGVTTSDCGYKGGLPGVDNGRIVFDRVRIPRRELLNRYADVAEDGTYSSPIESDNKRFFTMLGTLIRGRVTVGAAAGAAGRLGITLATKYALVRRQFDAPGGDNELLLLDYRTHQRRLLPLVARAYAFAIAQNELTAELHELQTGDPDAVDPAYAREIEGKAAAIKAGHTRLASDAISAAREACGGAGYLSENRLPLLRGDIDVFTTFEGDNLVLTQLVAKEQLTAYAGDVQGLDAVGWVRFVANMAKDVVLEKTAARQVVQTLLDDSDEDTEESDLTHPGTQLRLLRNREDHLLRTAAARMRRAKEPDEDPLEVFTETQDHLIKVGEAHIERIVLEAFVDAITDVQDRQTRDALKLMRNLYVYSLLERDLGWYLMHRHVSVERAKAIRRGVNELCGKARPLAESLVDAFGIPAAALDVPMLDPANSVAVR